MSLNTYTNEVMKALPAALRPNPWNIDEHVMTAIGNGWTSSKLAEASYSTTRNPTPALVVTNLRNLAQMSPEQTKPSTGWQYGHIKCDQHEGCELCRCVPGEVTHHVPVPMPEYVRAALTGMKGWGVLPDD